MVVVELDRAVQGDGLRDTRVPLRPPPRPRPPSQNLSAYHDCLSSPLMVTPTEQCAASSGSVSVAECRKRRVVPDYHVAHAVPHPVTILLEREWRPELVEQRGAPRLRACPRCRTSLPETA